MNDSPVVKTVQEKIAECLQSRETLLNASRRMRELAAETADQRKKRLYKKEAHKLAREAAQWALMAQKYRKLE